MTPLAPDRWLSVCPACLHEVRPWRPLELVFSTTTAKMSSVVRERWSQDPSWCVCQTHHAPHSWQLPPIHRAGLPAIASPRALAVADWSRNRLLAHVGPSSLSQEVDIATEPLSWTFHGRTLGRGPLPLAAEASSIAQALSLLLAPVDSPPHPSNKFLFSHTLARVCFYLSQTKGNSTEAAKEQWQRSLLRSRAI